MPNSIEISLNINIKFLKNTAVNDDVAAAVAAAAAAAAATAADAVGFK